MIAALGLGLLGMVLWQALEGPDANQSPSTPGAAAAEAQPAESQPKATAAMPRRVHHFAGLTKGNSVKIAYSADGRLIALANGNPTMTMQEGGTSRVNDNWKPSADILDAETGKTVVSLKLTTADLDAVLAATERVSHIEATALAFSPDGNVVAVGTSIGQVKLYSTRTGELVRSLDDLAVKLADKETPENWKPLRRAIGSVASLEFSPDGSLLAMCGGSFGDFSRVFNSVQRLDEVTTGPGRLKIWEVKTGTLKHDLVGHSHANAVSFSPDGSLLASAGSWLDDSKSGTGVVIWDAQTGEQIRSFRTTANGGTHAIAFSPDGKLLAIGTQRFDDSRPENPSTGGVSLVRVSSGIEHWLVTVPGWAKPMAFSPDGTSIIVLCGGRSIRFLEIGTGTTKHEIRPADSHQDIRWSDFAIAPQGHMLAIGGVDKERRGSVEVWSTRSSDSTNAPAATF
jgi:WD40 repeat protein